MTLELRDISLRYSKKIVLESLNLTFEGGQIHALLGENGAGKSTTANIICGELKPDSGEIFIYKNPVTFSNPKAAIEQGICYVHQTPMLADSITVRENLLLGIKKEYQKNIAPVTKMWIPQIALETYAKELSSGMRFFVALCSALIKQPRLLLLDEPTALLDEQQKAFLFENLTVLAQGGMNIIVITHNMEEAEKYCDTIDFLEDGHVVPKKSLPELSADAKNRANQITLLQDLSDDGLATLEKKLINWVLSSERKNCAVVPTDRKYTASNPNLTVLDMLTSALDIPENQKPAVALQMIKNAGVNITPFEKCKNLSGGMLQKLIFERELFNNPSLLLLCNPLQGLDTLTCDKTLARIKKAAKDGSCVLVLSNGKLEAL